MGKLAKWLKQILLAKKNKLWNKKNCKLYQYIYVMKQMSFVVDYVFIECFHSIRLN